jgi:hypothetical protein
VRVFALSITVVLALAWTPLGAEVVRIEILERGPFADGRVFGTSGPYEKLAGRLHYAVDPALPANRGIVDLDLAPRAADGRVHFSGDFMLLKPKDLARGSGGLLYEVNNRGNLLALGLFNDGPWTNDPGSAAEAGNGFLMERGFSLLWSAWNWDVVPGDGRLEIDLPVAGLDGRPITGTVAAEIAVERETDRAPLAWGGSRGYPPADPHDPEARLTVRSSPAGARREIPRGRWRFLLPADAAGGPVGLELLDGFQPDLLYEVVYRAKDPRVVGLGLAAIRDSLAFFRHEPADRLGTPNPLAAADGRTPSSARLPVLAFGFSQSGRVLQHMLWQGFHLDEAGRQIFDGAWIHGAGAGKGSFNHRFAQTTRHPSHYEDRLYPADVFPFTAAPETDPITGQTAGLLDRARAAGAVPLRFYSSTATEYWTRAASLLHSDVTGRRDIPPDPRARLYVFAGAQHGPGAPGHSRRFLYCNNDLDYRPAMRALLVALARWVGSGDAPLPSVYPTIASGSLGPVAAYRRAFPQVPGLRLPVSNLQPPRLDHGPRFARRGIADLQPARPGQPFVTLVPLPDRDGIDLGAIRLPQVAAPLAGTVGWNLRRADPERLGRWQGATLPFETTKAERLAAGDPRPALAERYGSRQAYLAQVELAAEALTARGFLLKEEIPGLLVKAARRYGTAAARAAACLPRHL